ncbi:hypothetical protein ACH5RR_016148 [Cinchona calisaya]|uniref:Uncharacterized protein n=1 Tax=Cinchona calisaya TaxID=153742 RepID=A0ABD2ZV61_9GENT
MGSEDQYFITTFMEKADATVAAPLKKQNAVVTALAKEKNAAAVQSEAVACFNAALFPNSIHHEVKFAAAPPEDKDTAAVWVERKGKVAVVHEVVAETAATPRPIINAAVCLGLLDDSAVVIGSKTQHFAAAAMEKNKTTATRAERLDTATDRASTSATKIVETSDVAATISRRKKAVATAEQPQNTRTGIDPIMTPRFSMNLATEVLMSMPKSYVMKRDVM